MAAYATILVPLEANYQPNLLNVYRYVCEIFNAGFSVYLATEPFVVKVLDEGILTYRPYMRSFGVNTFIVPVEEKSDLEELIEHAKMKKVKIVYTHERFWVKGRKLITTYINKDDDLAISVKDYGFTCERGDAYGEIKHYFNIMIFLSFKNRMIDEINYVRKEITIVNIDVCKPWHHIMYGVYLKRMFNDILNKRIEIYFPFNEYLENLAIINDEKHSLVTLSSLTDNVYFTLFPKQNNMDNNYVRLLGNVLFHICSERRNISI